MSTTSISKHLHGGDLKFSVSKYDATENIPEFYTLNITATDGLSRTDQTMVTFYTMGHQSTGALLIGIRDAIDAAIQQHGFDEVVLSESVEAKMFNAMAAVIKDITEK